VPIVSGQDVAPVTKIEVDDTAAMHRLDGPFEFSQEADRQTTRQRPREQDPRAVLDDQGLGVDRPQ